MDIQTIAVNEVDQIEVSISTKGVYTWTIRAIGHDVDKLVELNSKMKARFKNEVNTADI
jgi:hypothetical protein